MGWLCERLGPRVVVANGMRVACLPLGQSTRHRKLAQSIPPPPSPPQTATGVAAAAAGVAAAAAAAVVAPKGTHWHRRARRASLTILIKVTAVRYHRSFPARHGA